MARPKQRAFSDVYGRIQSSVMEQDRHKNGDTYFDEDWDDEEGVSCDGVEEKEGASFCENVGKENLEGRGRCAFNGAAHSQKPKKRRGRPRKCAKKEDVEGGGCCAFNEVVPSKKLKKRPGNCAKKEGA